MWSQISRFGLTIVLFLTVGGRAMSKIEGSAQPVQVEKPVKPTGPAAKKADDLIRSYTARIEKEIAYGFLRAI